MKTSLEFTHAAFVTSAARLDQCPPDEGVEFAFCGRSNAGKSSALNYLTSRKGLARTSKTPGRTRLMNFFSVGEGIRLVDLPGFGYAKVPAKQRTEWQRNIDAYLRQRRSLVGLIAVMDIRHPLREFDDMMIEWGRAAGLRVHVVLTKCDKLRPGARKAALQKVEKTLPADVTVQVFSATHGIGRDELTSLITRWLDDPSGPGSDRFLKRHRDPGLSALHGRRERDQRGRDCRGEVRLERAQVNERGGQSRDAVTNRANRRRRLVHDHEGMQAFVVPGQQVGLESIDQLGGAMRGTIAHAEGAAQGHQQVMSGFREMGQDDGVGLAAEGVDQQMGE